MKLHYSQTDFAVSFRCRRFTTLWNYTTLKLALVALEAPTVLLPYEITLLSNNLGKNFSANSVLLPYEITLLSNISTVKGLVSVVLLQSTRQVHISERK